MQSYFKNVSPQGGVGYFLKINMSHANQGLKAPSGRVVKSHVVVPTKLRICALRGPYDPAVCIPR